MSYDEKEAAEIKGIYHNEAASAEVKPDLAAEAAMIGVTVAKLTAMRRYASLLKMQEPRMKQSSIRKKVCEKFKVKLV